MNTNDLYEAYFEHQAIHHPDLQHSDTAKVFACIDIEQIGEFRSIIKEKNFFMRLIHYTYSVGDNGSHDNEKRLVGGFIISKYYNEKHGGALAKRAARTAAEKVTDDLIVKMISDSQAGHPLFNHSLNSRQNIQVSPFEGKASYVGWLCTFHFATYFPVCVEDTAWADGGATPHNLNEPIPMVLGDGLGHVLVDESGKALGL